MPLSSEESTDDPLGSGLEFVPRVISVDVRKFSGYVLVPGHESGKDRIFLDRLGFRTRNVEDAESLRAAYLERARSAIDAGEYELGGSTKYGRRCTIVIHIRGAAIRSGWFLRQNGVLELVTPFSGFSRPTREGSS